MKIEVKSLENKKVGDIDLSDSVFGIEVRADIITRAINWQMAKKQQGTHKTKTVSEISGTTKKPFKQKGTGNARQGSLRSAQMRGGATTFGPVVRSHAHDLPKKVRTLALKCALSSKVAGNKIMVLDSLKSNTAKTKDLIPTLDKLGIKNALIIDGETVEDTFKKAASNIHGINTLPTQGANVYDIIKHEMLVLTKEAVTKLEARLT